MFFSDISTKHTSTRFEKKITTIVLFWISPNQLGFLSSLLIKCLNLTPGSFCSYSLISCRQSCLYLTYFVSFIPVLGLTFTLVLSAITVSCKYYCSVCSVQVSPQGVPNNLVRGFETPSSSSSSSGGGTSRYPRYSTQPSVARSFTRNSNNSSASPNVSPSTPARNTPRHVTTTPRFDFSTDYIPEKRPYR